MPRLPPLGPKRDKSTDRAYVRWRGSKVYFGRWNSPEALFAFADWLAERRTEFKKQPAETPKRLTVLHCASAYLKHAITYYVENQVPTQECRNVKASMALLIAHAGMMSANQFGSLELIAVRDALIATKLKNGEQKYSRQTINAHVSRMRRALRWCASRGMFKAELALALNTIDGLRSGKSDAKETVSVEPVPIRAVIETLPFMSPTVRAMCGVQLLCGMRPQDVCGMKPGLIDRTGDVWLYRPAKHKNTHRGKELVKAIPLAAQELLRPHLNVPDTEPVFSPSESLAFWRSTWRKLSTPAATPRPRTHFKVTAYGKAVAVASAKAKASGLSVEHWTPNQLRHLVGTQLRGQEGIESAQLFLGHSKPNTTLIYAERSLLRLVEIARNMPPELLTILQPSSEEPRQSVD